MLTSILNGEKIIATDPYWADKKEELRNMCNLKAVCPVCSEPVTCRFGQVKIHHFAHKKGADCPGNNETEEHLIGKNLLYQFLKDYYKENADVQIENYFPELRSTCDIYISHSDGRKWAIEFYCGQIKLSELKKRLDFYKSKNIEVTWLISHSRIPEVISKNEIKVRDPEKIIVFDTGIDKLYCGNWYKEIVIDKKIITIPKDGDSKGSLYYFDIDKHTITIIRALQPSKCLTIFKKSTTLTGPLDKIFISASKNIWYFKEEQLLSERWIRAKKVLNELENEEKQKKEERIKAFDNMSHVENNYFRLNIQQPGLTSFSINANRKYTCMECNGNFYEKDMIEYALNKNEGICRSCSRNIEMNKLREQGKC